jgi:hypothetical protein
LKSIRKISPLISFLLAILLFAGNSGYTFVFHNCNLCTTQEVRHSIEIVAHGYCHLCGEPFAEKTGPNDVGAVMRHHCHHEIDRLMTSELVKTDLQIVVVPFLTTVKSVCLLPFETEIKNAISRTFNCRTIRCDLITLHCQLLS